uniref:Lipase n=1 Tax=Panagrellus redivivus TaxID=6233 RepID=A0A7E4VP20_PANRE
MMITCVSAISLYILLVLVSVAAAVSGPFTKDFQDWLAKSSYVEYDFPALHYGTAASFGGRDNKTARKIKHQPVIFIHGNSDGALDDGNEYSSGWTASIEHFMSNGYTSAELYAITWGDRNLTHSHGRTHSCVALMRVRRFIEAVLEYTNATQVDIIAHSMGVTLTRAALHGGLVRDDLGVCSLGEPLNDRVETFLGIAGANHGICGCGGVAVNAPVCGINTGFFPGPQCHHKTHRLPLDPAPKTLLSNEPTCETATPDHHCKPHYARNLAHLNAATHKGIKDADYVYSMWSDNDEILGTNSVWGHFTSHIPGSNKILIMPGMRHHGLKTKTVAQQFAAVTIGW